MQFLQSLLGPIPPGSEAKAAEDHRWLMMIGNPAVESDRSLQFVKLQIF
jgi:hypothetical protein